MSSRSCAWLPGARTFRVCVAAAFALLLPACATVSPNYSNQRAFATPSSAVDALVAAAEADDLAAMEAIFGPEGREVLSSGDPVADRNQREVFVVAMNQGWALERVDSSTRELVVGHEEWPFPIPLRKDKNGWWFDTVAGGQEVLARRIGRNELAAIGVLRTYVLAQREYASESRDGRPTGVYAQKVMSDEGRQNGLYWKASSPSDPPSPLGAMAAQAAADGYGGGQSSGPRPFYGYFYRILTEQGPSAPGGAMNYLVNGDMTGGFAMIAYPAEYMNSGVMSFIVGPDGVVYEADLGEDTHAVAGAMRAFDPDARWLEVELEIVVE